MYINKAKVINAYGKTEQTSNLTKNSFEVVATILDELKRSMMIVSEISGFPTFYTQLIFDTFDKTIKIKSVLHDTEGISILSNCEKLIKYKFES